MKIRAIETIPVRVPIRPERAIRSSLGLHAESTFVLVKIHTDDGRTGLGEVSATALWSGEDHVTATHAVDHLLAPHLLGQDPGAIETLTRRMDTVLAGHPFAKAGIEMALWDLLGKQAGLPLYRLLGGPVREHVTTKFSISGAAPERAAELAAWAVAEGFRTVKVKVGLDPDQDVARVRAVRAAIGPDVRLGIDANGGWSPQVAIRTIRRLADCDLLFAEQPCPRADVAWLADVRRNVPVPVMADESVFTLQDAMALVRAGAADILSVYVGKGGIGPARKIAAVAEAAGIVCTIGSNLEMGIATAAMIHLGIATPGVAAEAFPCDIIGPFYYDGHFLAEPVDVAGGTARPSEKPGLGVDLDPDAVERFRIR